MKKYFGTGNVFTDLLLSYLVIAGILIGGVVGFRANWFWGASVLSACLLIVMSVELATRKKDEEWKLRYLEGLFYLFFVCTLICGYIGYQSVGWPLP